VTRGTGNGDLTGNDNVRFLPARYTFECPTLVANSGSFATCQMSVFSAAGTVDWRVVNCGNKR
jgi:hypothetical protein